MAEGIGAAASIVGLVSATLAVFREVRKARQKVRATSKSLDDISKQLETLEDSLRLIGGEPNLQTAGVELQIKVVLSIAAELKSFFDRLIALQQRKAIPQFVHMLKSGDADEDELQRIHKRLDGAKQELSLRVSVTQVGVLGNLQDGFRVAFEVLTQTNARVQEVLGTNLVLMDLVRHRSLKETDGTIALNAADMEFLGGQGPQAYNSTTATVTNETSIFGNITLGQARVMTGDVGMEGWQRAAGRKTTIRDNTFGDGVRIMTGDQGGEAAARFNNDFWN